MIKADDESGDGQSAGTNRVDKTLSPLRVNVLSIMLTLWVTAAFFIPYALIWGSDSLWAVFDGWLLLVLVLSVVVHEVLHAVGYTLVGRVSWREVRFGTKWLMVYVHCRVPMTASAYRIAVVLPGVILGLVPGMMGLAWGNAWLTVYGTLMTISALGDLMILWLIRSVPGDVRVQDHPSAPGCQVLLE